MKFLASFIYWPAYFIATLFFNIGCIIASTIVDPLKEKYDFELWD